MSTSKSTGKRNGILKLTNKSEQKSANYGPRAKSSPPAVFVNKVFLEHSHAHLYLSLAASEL